MSDLEKTIKLLENESITGKLSKMPSNPQTFLEKTYLSNKILYSNEHTGTVVLQCQATSYGFIGGLALTDYVVGNESGFDKFYMMSNADPDIKIGEIIESDSKVTISRRGSKRTPFISDWEQVNNIVFEKSKFRPYAEIKKEEDYK